MDYRIHIGKYKIVFLNVTGSSIENTDTWRGEEYILEELAVGSNTTLNIFPGQLLDTTIFVSMFFV